MTLRAVARVDELGGTRVKLFRVTLPDGASERAFVLKRADGSVRAYRDVCRHLSFPLDWRGDGQVFTPDGEHLICGLHGAQYDPADGRCVSGPCEGLFLHALPVEVADGVVYLVEADTTAAEPLDR